MKPPPMEKKPTDDLIWFDKLSFMEAVKCLENVAQQLCHARDDTYHRACAEAKNEAYELVIKMFINQSLDKIDRSE